MKAVLQRVKAARVEIDGDVVGAIGQGLMILLGVAEDDGAEDVTVLSEKISKLRIFEDEDGKMNRSVTDVEGGVLVVSNFTLCGDYRKGNRPSFIMAGRPEMAEPLYLQFCQALRGLIGQVEEGKFGGDMQVYIQNDGPVTMVLDSKVLRKQAELCI